jgi:hypothetical protein
MLEADLRTPFHHHREGQPLAAEGYAQARLLHLTFPEALEQAELRNSAVDSHLNARAHEILATAMLGVLAPRLAAMRPETTSGDKWH